MCTLIAFHRCREDWPLVVAANRDERLDRPAGAPRASGRSVRVWAGIDREAGGTWLGINSLGLVVGLTNAARAPRDPARRSRGLLVLDLLAARCAEEAAEMVGSIEPQLYNPFQIFLAGAEGAYLATLDGAPGRGVEVRALAPGVLVLTNAAPGDPEEPRRAEVVRMLGVDGPAESKSLDDLKRILARHAPVPERSVCLHRPAFGTRSASIVAVGGRRAPLYLHAEGPPCRTAWADLSPGRGEITATPSAGMARRPRAAAARARSARGERPARGGRPSRGARRARATP
jgi:hypothetical protein